MFILTDFINVRRSPRVKKVINYGEGFFSSNVRNDLVVVDRNFIDGDSVKTVFWSISTLNMLYDAGFGLFANTDFKFIESPGFKVAKFYNQKPITNYIGDVYFNSKDAIKDNTNVICNANESVCIDGDKLLCYGPYVNVPFDVEKVNCGFYFNVNICKLYPLRDIYKFEEFFVSYGIQYWIGNRGINYYKLNDYAKKCCRECYHFSECNEYFTIL